MAAKSVRRHGVRVRRRVTGPGTGHAERKYISPQPHQSLTPETHHSSPRKRRAPMLPLGRNDSSAFHPDPRRQPPRGLSVAPMGFCRNEPSFIPNPMKINKGNWDPGPNLAPIQARLSADWSRSCQPSRDHIPSLGTRHNAKMLVGMATLKSRNEPNSAISCILPSNPQNQ